MADEQPDVSGDEPGANERNGDWVSVLYVVGGIPFLIGFFLVLFLLTGSCDRADILLPV